MAHSSWINVCMACKTVDPSLTCDNLSDTEMCITHIRKHYANVLFIFFTCRSVGHAMSTSTDRLSTEDVGAQSPDADGGGRLVNRV